MGLVMEASAAVFDLAQVKKGDLLWGRHATWDKGRAGFVTAAEEKRLTVQYYPGIGNVTNHFHIPVSEAAAGEWEIRWSPDLSAVQEYGIPEEDGDSGKEPSGSDSGKQQEDTDEPGRTDL